MSVLIRGFAAERGDEMALVDDERETTWAELDLRINQLIHAFRAAGIAEGDTISIVSGNRNEWFEVALACANTGVTFVPVNCILDAWRHVKCVSSICHRLVDILVVQVRCKLFGEFATAMTTSSNLVAIA